MARWTTLLLVAILFVLGAACDDSKDAPDATSTSGAAGTVPPPVAIAQQPAAGFTLGDPSLEALSGATVDFGRLGGMNYQIEKPDAWNGRLVMYAHGNDQDVELQVYPPVNRRWLVENGYAWASSSYSVNVAIVTGIAADELAAVWDHFASKYGRPQYTYVMGDSMGGSVAFQSAERYADRYGGSLPLCGDANAYDIQGDFFSAAAYVAGVTQEEWEAGGQNVGTTIDDRLRPMLRDPQQRARFIALWSDISGGARPFVDEGVAIYQEQIWTYVLGNLFQGVYDNSGRDYVLSAAAGVSSADFNAGVLRIIGKPDADQYADVNTITGDIKIPTLTVQMTGDPLTIFQQTQELRRRAEAKGRGDLLVQRAVQSPLHCFDRGITTEELRESFEDLAAWVEAGTKPAGEDLSAEVSEAGAAYTRKPRVGSGGAAEVTGAGDRVTVSGSITVDGEPRRDGFLWIDVVTDGKRAACTYNNAAFDDGRYTTLVATADEVPECGAEGRIAQLMFFENGKRFLGPTLPWPTGATELTIDATLIQANVEEQVSGTIVNGALLDATGAEMPIGTRVEALIGGNTCHSFTIPPVVMIFEQGDAYGFVIPPQSDAAGCTEGEEVTFRVDGERVEGSAVHDLTYHQVDLVKP